MSQEVQTVFHFNGKEYEFDIRDADDARKFEDACERIEAAEKAMPKDGRASDHIVASCNAIKDFFDICFGEKAGEDVCGKKNNISTHYEAYEAFLSIVRTQKNYIVDKGNTFRNYSNRNQRRHPQNPGQNSKRPPYSEKR